MTRKITFNDAELAEIFAEVFAEIFAGTSIQYCANLPSFYDPKNTADKIGKILAPEPLLFGVGLNLLVRQKFLFIHVLRPIPI
jgi:hypothetical protein